MHPEYIPVFLIVFLPGFLTLFYVGRELVKQARAKILARAVERHRHLVTNCHYGE